MYRRYENNNNSMNAGSRPVNDAGAAFRRSQYQRDATAHSQSHTTHRRNEYRHEHHSHNRNAHNHHNHSHYHEHKESQKHNKNPLLSFIPSSIYNPENGKILGFLSAEDLLLIAMILIFLDSEEEGDNLMVYALLYVLASEWIDIGNFFK